MCYLKNTTLAVAIILCAFFQIKNAIANTEAFVISNVKIETRAKSAVQARELAFKKALTKSFKTLSEKMVERSQLKNLEMPSSEIISDMVLDFEITSEKSSATHYRAIYTIRYNKEDVRRFFSGQSVNYSDISGQALLILPFLQDGNRTLLWSDKNPFLKAWHSETNNSSSLMPIAVPISDLQDMNDIKDNQALTYSPDKLRHMSARYGAKDAIVIIVSPQNGIDNIQFSPLNIYIYGTDKGRPEYITTLNISPSGNGNVIKQSIIETRRFLQEEWKRKSAVRPSTDPQLFNTITYFKTIERWLQIKSRAESVIGAKNLKITALRSTQAEIEINYNGGLERLNLALARIGLSVRPMGIDRYQLVSLN